MKLEIIALELEADSIREQSTSLQHPISETGIQANSNKTSAGFEHKVDAFADLEQIIRKKQEILNNKLNI